MRVLNDRDEKSEPSDLGVMSVLTHSLFAAMGIATVLLTPLPMLVAGLRLVDPWPKVCAILGAVIAILVFEISPVVVTGAFVFGLFVADGVNKSVPFWQMVGRAALLALVLGGAALALLAAWSHTGIWQAWSHQVHQTITQVASLLQEKIEGAAELEKTLLYEGPFLLVSGALISLWVSVGLVAHLGLLEANSAYSSSALKSLRVPAWMSGLFLGLFVLMLAAPSPVREFASGLYRLAGTVLFIQGTVCLARLMEVRKVTQRGRTVAFGLAVLLGFYALVGLGVLSPWILRKKEIKS